MARPFISALGAVGTLALIPAFTATLAAVDVDTYRELDQFMDVFERVRAEYVDEVSDEELMRGAINGMLNSLDPHSSFLDETGFERLNTQSQGEYGGLGLTVVMEDGAVKVIAPFEGTPADRAGIRAGDYITHLDGELIFGGTLDEAVEEMRGEPGTSIEVRVVRPGADEPLNFTLVREVIELHAVTSTVEDRVGIININTFNRNTAEEVRAAIASINQETGNRTLGYVIDLRSNPGGLLNQAIAVSDLFLERGEVVSQRGRHSADIERYYARPGDDTNGAPLVVLVDAGSASASEIVAGALQDHRRALVIGERTFGKGSVQTILPLTQDTALRLTTARYYTPSGHSVQEGGIEPDIAVPQLSNADWRDAPRFREADLRRHLINEAEVQEDVIEEDVRDDPRFSATPEELTEQGISDFQLHYAVETISRLARQPRTAVASAPRRSN
ncbi:S41 family peptidase [Parasphingopyxis marina]|uniref:S41 family peptidase n=1 Tax=Parasphingopyxis marina TaxID=2761622 RepID=A0A842I1P1_9SPHN|nr:S41 family peptidase [Parasphingopyxis marina]MBC2778681.1 S41 family peptidase [Parasphingopyxis marina]